MIKYMRNVGRRRLRNDAQVAKIEKAQGNEYKLEMQLVRDEQQRIATEKKNDYMNE